MFLFISTVEQKIKKETRKQQVQKFIFIVYLIKLKLMHKEQLMLLLLYDLKIEV